MTKTFVYIKRTTPSLSNWFNFGEVFEGTDHGNDCSIIAGAFMIPRSYCYPIDEISNYDKLNKAVKMANGE